MDIALERGAIFTNPVSIKPTEGRLKKKVRRKELVLPSAADVQRLFPAMEANGSRGGWGLEEADFCRFMGFTGCRVGEVPRVTWSCIDWDNRVLHIPGFKTDSSDRTIPMFGELETLLRRLTQRRKAAAAYAVDGQPFLAKADPLFRISECQKTIDRACAGLGIQRVTHHDFRQLFATRCIESGVDIPTVAAWLGHADGGALLMKTYSHHRRAHSMTQAAKVSFGTASLFEKRMDGRFRIGAPWLRIRSSETMRSTRSRQMRSAAVRPFRARNAITFPESAPARSVIATRQPIAAPSVRVRPG